jgi:glycosyltransferase involved in cell wall biosynthesis
MTAEQHTVSSIELVNKNARGGTELMAVALSQRLSPELLARFQIIPSRLRGIDPHRIPIYWLHDLPEGQESRHLANGGWKRFELLVYVSNWQAQLYQRHFAIPWDHGQVLLNAIEPIAASARTRNGPLKIIYHSTPHRGLELLVPVFEALSRQHCNVELHVFSSFQLYGMPQDDQPYADLFARCRTHPRITYHGTQPNDVVRAALADAHLFAYPSIWPETSCLCLMEAMSAGCLCVHSNFGALYETAANWTWMYPYQDNPERHMQALLANLAAAVESYWSPAVQSQLAAQKVYADRFFSWSARVPQWHGLLNAIQARRARRV